MVFLVGLGAAVLLAVGFVLQQHQAAQMPVGRIRPGLLLLLARRPVWLGGIAAMVGGQLMGAIALGLGSLVVVEPLLAANVLFALPLGAVASRRHLSAGDWVGALMLVGGLVLFLAGARPVQTVDTHPVSAPAWFISWACLSAVVVALLAAARRRGPRLRATLLAAAAGSIFGMQDFLTQRVLVRVGQGLLAVVGSWQPWVLVAVAITGLTFSQTAFGLADLSASLPALTLGEPVAGIALAAGALGQGFPSEAGSLAFAVSGLALMVGGVATLTRSPLVVDPHDARGRRALSGAVAAGTKHLHRRA